MKREHWGSRFSFILAAIGSAVGLGNAWRFPGQAAKNGGGSFLIAYIIALIVAGFPVLLMELTIGRKTQKGAPGAFKTMNKKLELVGWSSVATAFFICTYYAVIVGWILVMIVLSFKIPSAANPGNLFTNNLLELSSGVNHFGGFAKWAVLGMLVAWVLIYLCIRKGTNSVDKVTKFTVFIPLVLLVAMAIQGFTLPGAVDGLKMYLIPKWKELLHFDVWLAAFTQVFYSLSIMMAIMFAYGSFLKKDNDITKDTLIIVISDFVVSFISGLVIFTTLGYQAHLNGTSLDPSTFPSGVSLAFIVYPSVLAEFPGGVVMQTITSVVFYLALFTLAIDSAFSIVEGVSTAVSDKFHTNKQKTTRNICLVSVVISLLFVSKAGLYWLDIVDAWCNSVNLIIVGILETIFIGWVFGIKKVREEFNKTSTIKIHAWYDWMIKVICPAIFLALSLSFIIEQFDKPYEGYPIWALLVGGWLISIISFSTGLIIQVVSNKNKKILMLEENFQTWENCDEIHLKEEQEHNMEKASV